jgi:TetR/AcrR family transcriptional repressor of uid operon
MAELAAALPLDDEASPQDLRRTQILDAARICFARSGFHGASMQQVCAEAKMSPGALYRYFPSKEAIIEAIAEDERMKASGVMAAFGEPGSIIDRLMRAASAYFALMKRPGGGELMMEICSESIRNTVIGTRFHCIETDVKAGFAASLEAAKAAGEIDPDVDVETAVAMLFAIGDGMVMRMSLDRSVDGVKMEAALRRVLVGLLGARTVPGADADGISARQGTTE